MRAVPACLRRDVALADHTTLAVGGRAAWWAECPDVRSLQQALAFARLRRLPVAVLGGGSNTLAADAGFEGVVVAPRMRGLELRRAGDAVIVEVGAGEPFDEVVAWAVGEGLAGVECLAGIPGLAGAAPIQNIGAYGQELADICEAVTVLDPATGALQVLPAAACAFGYRHSRFKAAPGREIVVSVGLRLRPGGAPSVAYPQLAAALSPGAGLVEIREAVLALRRGKSMVWDPADPNHRSAGSFFMNPVLPEAEAAAVVDRARQAGLPTPPVWPAGPGQRKLSAAWLIERAGFERGVGEGPVGLSSRHSLALINRGGARAAQLLRFAARIRAGVWRAFGVALAPEPMLLGFSEGQGALLSRLAPLGSGPQPRLRARASA